MRHEILQSTALEGIAKEVATGNDPAPFCVEFHPTDFCNQACVYCFHGGNNHVKTPPEEPLTIEEYVRIIDQATAMGVSEISISGGGEPLLYKDMAGLLDKLSGSELGVRIVTNGNFLPNSLVEKILKIKEIRFSVDTLDTSTYNSMRGLPPSSKLLSRTLQNIKTLVAARNNDADSSLSIGTTFLANPYNATQAVYFAEFMIEEVGVDAVVFKRDIHGTQDPSEKQIEKLEEDLEYLDKKYPGKVDVRQPIDRDNINGNPCVIPYLKIALNPYGQVFSCCLGSQPGENNGEMFGAWRHTGSLEELWQQSRDKRTLMLGGVACTGCNATDQALNNAYAKTGSSFSE